MRYGIEVVPFGEYADPGRWWTSRWPRRPPAGRPSHCGTTPTSGGGVGDPWVTLAAVAAQTERLRLVTGVSPVPRYRPVHLARTLHALDALSGGRVTLGAGLGVTAGVHYRARDVQVCQAPVQRPIPIWIGGSSVSALRRAARWDGWTVGTIDETCSTIFGPERVAEGVRILAEHSEHEVDVAVSGASAPGSGVPAEYEQAGANWWFESLFGLRGTHREMLARVAVGSPT